MPYSGQSSAPHLDPGVAGLDAPRPAPRRRLFGRGLTEGDSPPTPADIAAWSGQLAAPVPSPRRIGVIALKGGVGKTTLAVLLASALARHRREVTAAVTRAIVSGTGKPDYSFQECSALIGQ